MTKIPSQSGLACIKKLQKIGFVVKRQRGSHFVLGHSDGRITVVPCHKGQDLDSSLIRKILKDIKVEPEDFNNI